MKESARKPWGHESWGEWFERALKVETPQEAEEWIQGEMSLIEMGDDESKRKSILDALGYMAGYYDHSVSVRVFDLFNAVHPVFGTPEEKAKLTPEDCFKMGIEFGQKHKKEQ